MLRVLLLGMLAASALGLLAESSTSVAQQKEKANKAKVTGTIESRAEAAFKAETIARVSLQDVSKADAPAETIGEQTIRNLKRFPIAFVVEYDPAAIEPGHTYSMSVRIETGKKLNYINDTSVEVISRGKPTEGVKVPVIPVAR